MTEIIEMGTISARGQICIPSAIRDALGLDEGSKVIFVVQNESLFVKKIDSKTFATITAPLKEEAKKAGLKESSANSLVQKFRKNS
jgi:AbrB family looped-hinge helix DNA binding protein